MHLLPWIVRISSEETRIGVRDYSLLNPRVCYTQVPIFSAFFSSWVLHLILYVIQASGSDGMGKGEGKGGIDEVALSI